MNLMQEHYEVGFTALPCCILSSSGRFYDNGDYGAYWTLYRIFYK
jgi:hypothetical protein